ncbi:hypothetical protein B4N89_09250 [Embleya scabrispora]|uniref:Uncharacterized protein n=1 Tax=Embleya scabrispora TaxID=159449 RepID=A0A1T3NWE9_9ACTN|nr:ATP-binding protein [Embleya scabrispora]OPC81114.1 hypothetical protein B4N89_09250 [Embleya scabrispora]
MNGGGRQRPEEGGEQHFGDEPPRPSAGDREVSGGDSWSDFRIDSRVDSRVDSWGDDAYLDELFGPRPGGRASASREVSGDSGGFGTADAGGFGGGTAGFEPATSGGSAPGFGTDGPGKPPSGRGESIRIDDDWSDPAPSGRAGTDEPGPSVLRLYAGDLLLTFGGADGTDVAPVPAGARPPRPSRLPGSVPSAGPEPLGRDVEIAELTGLLQRGTSVRIGGPASSGRTTLLRRLAALDPAHAPDGVILLDGRRRGLDDLLQQLHDACFGGPAYRPTRVQLTRILADVAALVVIDDLDIGQEDVAELLRIAPECAFLVAGPELVDPIARRDSPLHEITLHGLPQEASFDLLRRVAGRELDDEELSWASALWFQVGGHPGRFVQAGALLARRERGRYGLLDDGAADGSGELPSPGDPRQFVPRLVPLVSASAQQVLRLASALEGELPDPVHLPALTGAVDAVGAADELVEAGLAACEFGRYRLTGGTAEAVASIVRGPSSWAVAAIQHFTWWVSHPSVTPAEIAREADTILACLRESERLGKAGSARALARASAPAFGASARWDTWGEVLDLGLASARAAGASAAAEHAWFRHELAILALCTGDSEGAREEAVAATRMRDVGSDKRGLAADRRVLALAGGDRAAVAAVGQEGAAGAERGGIGRRGVLMTAGAAVVLVVTLAAVVAMGSDSPDRGDHRNPVGSTGSATYDPKTPNRGPEADPKADRDKPPPPTGSRKPGTGGATTTATATARETTAPNTSAPATAPRSSTPANSASQSASSSPTSAPPTPTRVPPTTSTTPESPAGEVKVPVGG